MTLLTPPPKLTASQKAANRALKLPLNNFNRLLKSWRGGIKMVWNPRGGVTAAQVLAAIGPQAAELFARSSALKTFLEAQQPGSTNVPELALIKPHTSHADGTVTIDPMPTTPAPAKTV